MKGGSVVKKIISLAVAIIVTAFVTVAHAEVKAGSASITPFVGAYFFEDNENLKDSAIAGFRAAYSFTENFALEGMVSYTKSNMEDAGDLSRNVYGCGIDAIYHFMPEGRFVPFVALGVGGIHYGYPDPERSSKFTVDYGAGVKYFMSDNVALRFDVRHIMPQNERWNDILATVGITFSFGGHPKIKKAPETCDKDNEAVAPPKVVEQPPVVAKKEEVAQAKVVEAPPVVEEKKPEVVPPAPVPAPVEEKKPEVVPPKVEEPPAPVEEKKPEAETPQKVSLSIKMEFDTGKAVINKKYHKELAGIANFMKLHPDADATIAGHTDNQGSRIKNIQLSKARANSVREYLIKKFGIDPSRIRAFGYGPDRPLASNKTKEGRQKNRRIVAVFETTKK
jgi:OmpA-OmpF porin, OOP family